MKFSDFIPAGNWFIECYHILTSDETVRINSKNTLTLKIDKAVVIITRRPITYESSLAKNLHISFWKRGGDAKLAWNNPGKHLDTEYGTIKAIICVPNTNDNQVDVEIKYIKSILALKYGLTITWSLLTQYIIDNKGKGAVSESPSYKIPFLMFEEDKDFDDLIVLSDAIACLSKNEQSIAKIALSLFYDSVFSTQEYDQLLKSWFAIEILCKVEKTYKKDPIKAKLINIYGDKRYDDLVDFLYDIRNAITHDGYSGGIWGGIIDAGEALFYDLFCYYCKVSSPRRIEKIIDFYSLDLNLCRSQFKTCYTTFFN